MLPEISLHILDLAENSIQAGATLIQIQVVSDRDADQMTVSVTDNGHGMTRQQLAVAADPFFTSRDARPVGLGLSFFQYAAESTGGSFSITSKPGKGTTVTGIFIPSHIDCMPLGNLAETMQALVIGHPQTDFTLSYRDSFGNFSMDTRELDTNRRYSTPTTHHLKVMGL